MISVILVTQEVSEKFVKSYITDRDEIYPVILEIPSKEKDYEAHKDTVMQRAHRLLYGSEISPDAQWKFISQHSMHLKFISFWKFEHKITILHPPI